MKTTNERLNSLEKLLNEGRLTKSEFIILKERALKEGARESNKQNKGIYSADSNTPLMRGKLLEPESDKKTNEGGFSHDSDAPMMRAKLLEKETGRAYRPKFNQNKSFQKKEVPNYNDFDPVWFTYKWAYRGMIIAAVLMILFPGD